MNELSIRQIEIKDFESIINYFLSADMEFLLKMGVDSSKLPSYDEWLKLLLKEYHTPMEKKSFYYVIWMLNNIPVGHSNINKIVFGDEAYMHLHLWKNDSRQKGLGLKFMKMSIPYYFDNFKLKKLYCEPFSLNPAPNKTLQKLGFTFIKEYKTTPGWINFYQSVNRWCLDLESYESLW